VGSVRHVYFFGEGTAEGGREMEELLGGKGANLAEMSRIGVPVPPGFTITAGACRAFLERGEHPPTLEEEVAAALERLESSIGKRFGGASDPLLVSVRSGAAVSMPGMMDTILNLGLNDRTAAALAEVAGDERFAWDSYRRFVQMYANVVMGVGGHHFEELIEGAREYRGVEEDNQLLPSDLRKLVSDFKHLVRESTGSEFPEEPREQLWGAIDAVFRSWNTPRSVAYRRVHGIRENLGTAVNVQAMVFGNLGEDSGTGVAFTRNPSTGASELYGEFLTNAQGEDVVAGIRDPLPLAQMRERFPEAFDELVETQRRLERHYRDMQDIEFTVERGKLFLLQTRTGKRAAAAAVRIATDLVDEGVIDREGALRRLDAGQLEQLLHPTIDPSAEVELLTTALPASPGAAFGRVVFSPDEAATRGDAGEPVILVRRETSPEDFHGMVAAQAILTCRGGMTSHAAVVARGMGKPCVAGAGEVEVDEARGHFTVGGQTVEAGDWITLDGGTGRVIRGRVPTVPPEPSTPFRRVMEWADGARALGVRANADTPKDARLARSFGAEGIGLCRTEHMFFEGDRIDAMRRMILAETRAEREHALSEILPMQRDDFMGIFRAMDGLPVTIRLLDPPLHEFLPHGAAEIKNLAKKLGVDAARLRALVERHQETNPMLGHRGVRLGISFPEITRMQARAIFEAAVSVAEEGVQPVPEIMVPLVATSEELRRQRALIEEAAESAFKGVEPVPYLVGTMIELPRAALTAAEIARDADFFSFGTNDLTQTTFGLSRDDAGTFLPAYVEMGVLPDDPFQTLDREGVGRLVEMGTTEGRSTRGDLKVGVCGEHGGDPRSVSFFHAAGLDYVSCSPFRVPVARLAAAQAQLENPRERIRGGAERQSSRGAAALAG
jgi:pyruvate, orthophosphate dikinase